MEKYFMNVIICPSIAVSEPMRYVRNSLGYHCYISRPLHYGFFFVTIESNASIIAETIYLASNLLMTCLKNVNQIFATKQPSQNLKRYHSLSLEKAMTDNGIELDVTGLNKSGRRH